MAILLLGIQGCEKEEETVQEAVGLKMAFIDNAPPSSIQVKETFPIYVDVSNKGSADVDAGAAKFYLSGVGDNLQNVVLELQNKNKLEKKTDVFAGGKERLTFATSTVSNLDLENPFNLPLLLTGCYDYTTITEATICVGKEGDICQTEGEKITGESNSVAPVTISSLTENIVGKKLVLSFNIVNKGNGQVFLPDTDCDKLQQRDINEQLKKNRLNLDIEVEEGFSCYLAGSTGGSVMALKGEANMGRVTCEKIIGEEHETTMKITMNYKYRESVEQEIELLPE